MTDFFTILIFGVMPLLALIAAVVLYITGRGNTKLFGNTLAAIIAAVLLIFLFGLILRPSPLAQESARRAACLGNLRQITIAMIQYANDNNGAYPSALVDDSEPAQLRFARLLKLGYLNAPKLFHCVSAPNPVPPDPSKLDAPSLTECSLKSIADAYLVGPWCSYGLDPRVTPKDHASRAVAADRPDHRYWGPHANSPPGGQPGSNSENHKGAGQNVGYNDGHVKWASTCVNDSSTDPNIFAANPDISPANDSNIRYGAPPTPEKKP